MLKRARLSERLLKSLPDYLRDQVGIPEKFVGMVDFELSKNLSPYTTFERGLCLSGPAGTGKTTSLCLLAKEYYLKQISKNPESIESVWNFNFMADWKFISFPKFIMELQDAWRQEKTEDTAFSILSRAAKTKYLIIDDLGAEKLTDYVRQATYYPINEREQWERPTYITTNFSLSQLDEQFDSRISSRIAGMCDVREIKGKDLRLTKQHTDATRGI